MTGDDTTHLPLAIFLMGPTASGKTRLAVELVRRFPCEIISVDSAQVYRGLDIGTGKPDADTLRRAPHRLLDIRDPAEAYSAAAFREDALAAMAEITAAGRIPLLVGGTMLYFRVLKDGLAPMPAADPGVRRDILAMAGEQGWEGVHRTLAEVDPESAARLRPTDSQRLQRALEVYRLTGTPISRFHRHTGDRHPDLPYHLQQLALAPAERSVLHERISERFFRMLEAGFLDEVRALRAREDLDPALPALRSVGYRQIWEYLEGQGDYDSMIARSLAATRQLAKRQLTWLRRWPDVTMLDSEDPALVEKCLKNLSRDSIYAV